jgi:hypothetical protein
MLVCPMLVSGDIKVQGKCRIANMYASKHSSWTNRSAKGIVSGEKEECVDYL